MRKRNRNRVTRDKYMRINRAEASINTKEYRMGSSSMAVDNVMYDHVSGRSARVVRSVFTGYTMKPKRKS
jgi:hypothetical protein